MCRLVIASECAAILFPSIKRLEIANSLSLLIMTLIQNFLKTPSSFSSFVLIAANLVPLVGAVFYGWDPKLVLALFWIENLIIGAFNLVKMLSLVLSRARFAELFTCVFFVLHYGLFCTVHGVLLWGLLDLGSTPVLSFNPLENLGPLEFFGDGIAVLFGFINRFEPIIYFGIAALCLSHFVSFIENFILRGEIFQHRIGKLMTQPYGQIIAMHAGLIVGAMALEKLGSPIWLLAIIVLLKLCLDLAQHQRRRAAARRIEI